MSWARRGRRQFAAAVTAKNALSIVELAGRPELPVYAGCPRPLGRKLIDARERPWHGRPRDLVLPAARGGACARRRDPLLIDRLRGAEPRASRSARWGR